MGTDPGYPGDSFNQYIFTAQKNIVRVGVDN